VFLTVKIILNKGKLVLLEETHVDWHERMMQIEKMKKLLEELRSKRE
jgi:hypothetical protein